jgi:hypothetical protein
MKIKRATFSEKTRTEPINAIATNPLKFYMLLNYAHYVAHPKFTASSTYLKLEAWVDFLKP